MACIPPITLPTNKVSILVKMIKDIITQTPAPSLSTTQRALPTTPRAQTTQMHASRVRQFQCRRRPNNTPPPYSQGRPRNINPTSLTYDYYVDVFDNNGEQ